MNNSTKNVLRPALPLGLLLLMALATGCPENAETQKSTGTQDVSGVEREDFHITPAGVEIRQDGPVLLTAVGGKPPFTWRVSNTTLGSVTAAAAKEGVEARRAVYTPSQVAATSGVNTVTATDALKDEASAVVVQGVKLFPKIGGINPGENIATNKNVTVTVTLGLPPYRWSVANPNLGSLLPQTGPSVQYRPERRKGVNIIRVTDANGNRDEVTFTQGE